MTVKPHNDSRNVSATVLTTNTPYPAVLNLLPFSKNDAASLSRDLMHAQVAMSHQMFPSLPVLTVSVPYVEHKYSRNHVLSANSSDSLSAAYSNKAANFKNKQVILTVSSDKAIHGHSHSSSSRDDVTSENESVLSDSKDDSTKDSLNVNGQFRRGSKYISQPDVSKSLPKPVFKPTECWKLYENKRRNYQTGHEEKELERHKTDMDLESTSGFQHTTRRVKVNVKELPRSKSPIAENDPDKLNMKQVIAFLQANRVVTENECHEKNTKSAEQVSPTNPAQLAKRLSLSSALPNTRRKEFVFDKKQQIIKLNRTCSSPSNASAIVQPKEISPDRYSTSRTTSCNSQSSYNTAARVSSMKAFRHSSPRTPHARGSVIYQHGSKIVNVDVSQHVDQSRRSIYFDKRQNNVKVSDKHTFSDTYKPQNNHMEISYRLNRYIGLGRDKPKNVVIIPSGSQQDQQGRSADISNEALRSASNVAEAHKHSDVHTSSYSLPSVANGNGILIHRQGMQSHSKYSHISCIENERTSDRNKVICLPTAQIEPDSDEESLLPSNVGSVQCKLDVTLPTKGRDLIKAGNTANTESTNSNSVTAVRQLASVHGQEPTQDNASINIENTVPNETTDDTLQFQTVHTKLNELSTRLAEGSGSSPGHPTITVTDLTGNKTLQDDLLTLTNPDAHRNTLIRFLNDDLTTMTRTRHWLEDHSKLFPPLICKHKPLPDESQSPPRSREQIRLSLRKERNKTRVHTYMTDMGEHYDEQ